MGEASFRALEGKSNSFNVVGNRGECRYSLVLPDDWPPPDRVLQERPPPHALCRPEGQVGRPVAAGAEARGSPAVGESGRGAV